PAVRYVTGTPANGGGGGVRLDVTVREEATGYEEQNSTLVTIVASPVGVRVVPETASFKPGLPLALLVTTETPDHQPVDASVALAVNYQDAKYQTRTETRQVTTKNGAAVLKITPGKDVVTTLITPSVGNGTRGAGDYTGAPVTVRAAYSPSGAFIHVEQTSQGALKVGDIARFTVTATGATGSATVYYEVLGRGQVVYSDIARGAGGAGVTIAVPLTPALAPSARLLVYQILPNSEVAADWLPFKVAGTYPQAVTVKPEKDEVRPGDGLTINVQTEGVARVGLAAVDKAVFILAENRLNLQQVFDEIEQLYETPQAEIHDQQPVPQPLPNQGPVAPRQGGVVAPMPDAPMPGGSTINPGAKETFQGAGVMVLTNRRVPEGKQLQEAVQFAAGAAPAARSAAAPAQGSGKTANAPVASPAASAADTSQAEPARTRQFFPETWVWADLTTGADGKAAHKVTAPDSITTWNLRAVALSKEKGLGIGEAELRVFQPFFVSVDLPYTAIRGEEFPVKIAVYNYTNAAQQITVELADADWFDLLDVRQQQVTVEAQGVGSAAFTIRPTLLGARKLTVTAKGGAVADAIVKELLVEPEGVAREQVTNLTLTPGTPRTVALAAPAGAIAGSPRALVALTGNVLSQTIEGLDNLLQMPYGCGEQNMLLFAPDVFITRYLKETGQEKPEIAAKAEVLMLTGYQRELTYRRDDGSFSAFGQSDKVGSLWLTAFVLKTFAQAKDLIFIDDSVLAQARDWIRQGQKADGSFDPIGFIHHQDMLGGLRGKPALTAFVAIALREAGDDAGAAAASRYLEGQLAGLDDAYSLAIVAYALALAQSKSAGAAHDRLLAIAHDSDDGLSWGDEPKPQPLATPAPARPMPQPYPAPNQSATIETTGYAALALLAGGDKVNAGRAVRWLASRRNAQGGFGSTQDTVVALQALTSAASSSRADLAATVTVSAGSWRKDVQFTPDNADVMQIVELPDGARDVILASQGKGQLMAQAVSRYNLPAVVDKTSAAFQIDVRYSADQIATNDLLTITAQVHYTPPEPLAAGMIVLDIAVPTGFAPETPSLDALAKRTAKIKRWDVAGRKVIFYLEDMQPDELLTLTFQARALYPVRAQATVSQVYAYYRPDWRGESLGARLIVT
ncbi:MAG: alpha-2-macroglobulin family protein, partial [Thermomicrobiales bacterium]